MAYKDSSGRITIDENAAARDRKKIRIAITKLEATRRELDNLINQAGNEKGQTSTAVVEKAQELRKKVNGMITNLNETDNFIGRVVQHYFEVDKKVKEAVQAAQLDGGNDAFGSGGKVGSR